MLVRILFQDKHLAYCRGPTIVLCALTTTRSLEERILCTLEEHMESGVGVKSKRAPDYEG